MGRFMTVLSKTALDMLRRHEGFRSRVYRCTAGRLTIGYGYNLDANPLHLTAKEVRDMKIHGITRATAELLFIRALAQVEHQVGNKIIWLSKLNQARKGVLINMAYQMGVDGLMKFRRTLSLIERGEYAAASVEMLDSKWAWQTKNRALELSAIMRTGVEA